MAFRLIPGVMARHKVFTIVLVLALGGGGFWWYARAHTTRAPTRYGGALAERGTLVTSISGSGQISAQTQLDLKAKASGDVLYVGVKEGQTITAGTIIAQIDNRTAQKAVRDAETNLASAQLALTKLQQPLDALSLTQAQNALALAQEARTKAADDLKKAYDDGFNTVANAFLGMPNVISGLDTLLYDSTIDRAQRNIDWYGNQVIFWDPLTVQYKAEADVAYQGARKKYNDAFLRYKTVNRTSTTAQIESIIVETYDTVKVMADTIKTVNNYLDFCQDLMTQHRTNIPALVTTHQTNLDSYTSTTNTYLLNLLAAKQSIETDKTAMGSSDRTITEKTAALAKLKAGTDPLDIQSQQLTLTQRQNALRDAQEQLADYTVRAPFGGVVATVTVLKGSPVSLGGVVATMVAPEQLAEISLNEVDVAKVQNGQKVTMTFDAVPDLTLTGKVLAVGTLGTVTQGVVTYTVKIVFDTQDARVKPGMSVAAAIITDVKTDVLVVPNSAVKSSGSTNYVEVFQGPISTTDLESQQGFVVATPPRRQIVQIGLANDTATEITQGLSAGDAVVTRAISAPASSATTQTQQRSILQQFGGGGRAGGAGNIRTGGGAPR